MSVDNETKVAGYVRISTQQQRDDGSHETQRDQIREWAADNLESASVMLFEDLAVSGQSSDRDGYNELMERYDEFEYVVVRELSRFGRDPVAVLRDAETIMESSVEFVSVTEPMLDTTSSHGKLMMRLIASMNGFYADLRREQAIRAAERRAESDKPVGRPPKIDDVTGEKVENLREKGLSYKAIARVIEGETYGPESISWKTVSRFCDE